MEIIVHRINTLKELKKIPHKYGVEIDIRTNGSKIILNHKPFKKGDKFVDYIANYGHGTLILNVKESGIEEDILKIVKKDLLNHYIWLFYSPIVYLSMVFYFVISVNFYYQLIYKLIKK